MRTRNPAWAAMGSLALSGAAPAQGGMGMGMKGGMGMMGDMGTGTGVAMESTGVTPVKRYLTGIVRTIHLPRATLRNIRQNLWFAFGYNSLGVPLAAGLLLSPIIAAAMSLSSVSVIGNALRLNRATV